MIMRYFVVEARGIEPLSENQFIRVSTSVVYPLHSLAAAPINRLGSLVSLNTSPGPWNSHGTFTTKMMPWPARGPSG